MRVVVDMNLAKDWVDCLRLDGHDAVHWSSLGRADADDADIMEWAAANDHVVLTADLDFGSMLAATNSAWPSVVQIRIPKTLSAAAGSRVREAIRACAISLESGALVTIDADRFRSRPPPLRPTV